MGAVCEGPPPLAAIEPEGWGRALIMESQSSLTALGAPQCEVDHTYNNVTARPEISRSIRPGGWRPRLLCACARRAYRYRLCTHYISARYRLADVAASSGTAAGSSKGAELTGTAHVSLPPREASAEPAGRGGRSGNQHTSKHSSPGLFSAPA